MDKKVLLSTLWIFLTVNFIFCDVFTLMHSEDLKNLLNGTVDGLQITQEFLLGFAFMMELPMAMILLSRILAPKWNKSLNIVSGILLAFVQIWSLSVGKTTLHYSFFSIIEIGICITIVFVAWKWILLPKQ